MKDGSGDGATQLKIGVFGLTSCGGDQAVLFHREEDFLRPGCPVALVVLDLLDLDQAVGQLDAALVEGAVAQDEDRVRLAQIRKNARILVAFGTCAVFGGWVVSSQGRAYPLSEYVRVDFSLPGCPVDAVQLDRVLGSLTHGDLPRLGERSVCFDCRLQENECLLKAKKTICLGPVTTGGCSALCVSHRISCRGCRGPLAGANHDALIGLLQSKGWPRSTISRSMETFFRGATGRP